MFCIKYNNNNALHDVVILLFKIKLDIAFSIKRVTEIYG